MPCGFRDQRRQSYRCVHCQAYHRKCDRQRPCKSCKLRNLKCVEPSSDHKAVITFIEHFPSATYPSIDRILGDDSWLYVRIFFDAVASSDMVLLPAFQFEEVGRFMQDNKFVFDAVAAVGAIYGSQTKPSLCISPNKATSLRKFYSVFRQYVATRLKKPYALQDTPLLCCIELLALLELMLDKTAAGWAELFELLQNRLSLRECTLGVFECVETSFFNFFRFCLAFRDLLFFDQVPSLARFMKVRQNIPVIAGPQKQFLTTSTEMTEALTRMIDFWAQLRVRSFEWARGLPDASTTDTSPPSLSSEQIQTGLEIVDQACMFQQELIIAISRNASGYSESHQGTGNCMMAFYHWILVGLCHMLSKPEWVSLGWRLPIMHETLMKDQALMALGYAERLIEKNQLEDIFYAPISLVAGVELPSTEDRIRVLRFLQRIKKTGFASASAFEHDLRLSWAKE